MVVAGEAAHSCCEQPLRLGSIENGSLGSKRSILIRLCSGLVTLGGLLQDTSFGKANY